MNAYAQTREEVTEPKIVTKTPPKNQSAESEKIDPQITRWMSSPNPEAYALSNNLVFTDNKIQVYLYLDSSESISDIPSNIEVLDSEGTVVLAFVTSADIDQLVGINSILKIAPPLTAIPDVESEQDMSKEEGSAQKDNSTSKQIESNETISKTPEVFSRQESDEKPSTDEIQSEYVVIVGIIVIVAITLAYIKHRGSKSK